MTLIEQAGILITTHVEKTETLQFPKSVSALHSHIRYPVEVIRFFDLRKSL